MNRIAAAVLAVASCAIPVVLFIVPSPRMALPAVHASKAAAADITVDYPRTGSIFPPEITPPTFLWHDAVTSADRWSIDVSFADGSAPLHFESTGDKMSLGEIDPRTVAPVNELPQLTPELADAHSWRPDTAAWEQIKKHSVAAPATVVISGFRQADSAAHLSVGKTAIQTSSDPVGAPIFYRDVPLMPSEVERGVIKPLAPAAIPLIQWRLRNIGQLESRVVLEKIHTCANCHSFSLDGKTMGMDMDGPQNDKGLYALVGIKPQMSIDTKDMVNWDPSQEKHFAFNRVAFMSQVSPTGNYVLTMVTRPDRPTVSNAYVANFKDYRFLQVFYPARGILVWLDRATSERHPLPGADDPDYVQTNGVWSPDEKFVVFARAKAREPYPAGVKMAAYANDPNELQIQYDLYRVPFNQGRGGKAEPILGASNNGMSNSFPKVSPDGRWIVFVQCRNGELMRPDSQLYIVPSQGGKARRLNANMFPMNSWHSWSPNGRWLVFSSKSRGPYTKMFLTHIDEQGNDSPAILIDNATASNRAVNIPEFVNIAPDEMQHIATPAVDMYKLFDRANELAVKGHLQEAVEAWAALAASYPDDALIRNNLGTVLDRTGRPGEAAQQYEKALQINPAYSRVHRNLALALMRTGETEEALHHFQLALEVYPELTELHNNYAHALTQAGHLSEARDEFAKIIELDPTSAEAHNNLGIALAMQGQIDEAAKHFAKAVELKPDFVEAHVNLGKALGFGSNEISADQAAKAEQEFKAAIAIEPLDADAMDNLGSLYRQQGKGPDAEHFFNLAIECAPTLIKAYVDLSDLLASESRRSEADAVLQKALQIDPNNRELQSHREQLKVPVASTP
jgi:tetratricopeptide (TPR) repeat protein